MDFEWDDRKAELNLAEHGLAFEAAIEIVADPCHLVLGTARAEDGEDRRKAIGVIQNRIMTVVFVDRGSARRVISARRANRKEERAYGESNP